MFCQNCGNKIQGEANFCSSCGNGIKIINKEQEQEKTPSVAEKKESKKMTNTFKTIIGYVVSFVSIIGGMLIGKYLGLLVLLMFFGAYYIGQWFGKWYLKRKNINITLIQWIVWSNILTWLLPPLGILTSFATLEFSNNFPKESKKYKTVAIIGIVASLLNALSGILINN